MASPDRTIRDPHVSLQQYHHGELLEHIRAILADSPFHGEGYRKVWARLRFQGIRTSRSRVLRLMRENQLLASHRRGNPHGPKAHDGKITTERVEEMWGTDMTSTITTTEGQAAIFFAVDHCSMKCVGMHTAKRGTRFEALEPIRQGVRESSAPSGKVLLHGLPPVMTMGVNTCRMSSRKR